MTAPVRFLSGTVVGNGLIPAWGGLLMKSLDYFSRN